MPLHVNITHTPPPIVDENEVSVAAADPGFIGASTLVVSEFSTGSYGWKGSKRVTIELPGAEGEEKEKVQVMITYVGFPFFCSRAWDADIFLAGSGSTPRLLGVRTRRRVRRMGMLMLRRRRTRQRRLLRRMKIRTTTRPSNSSFDASPSRKTQIKSYTDLKELVLITTRFLYTHLYLTATLTVLRLFTLLQLFTPRILFTNVWNNSQNICHSLTAVLVTTTRNSAVSCCEKIGK